MPRIKMFDEEKALAKALELFWEKGFKGTSLTDLTTQLGIGKGSFYDTFGSKKQLFDSCLSIYRQNGYETLDSILYKKNNVKEGIRYFLNEHTKMMLNDSEAKGCFIANSTVELSDSNRMIDFLKEHNQIMKSKLVDYLNHDSFDNDIEDIANAILNHLTGISVMSKFIKDKDVFNKSNDLFMQLVK